MTIGPWKKWRPGSGGRGLLSNRLSKQGGWIGKERMPKPERQTRRGAKSLGGRTSSVVRISTRVAKLNQKNETCSDKLSCDREPNKESDSAHFLETMDKLGKDRGGENIVKMGKEGGRDPKKGKKNRGVSNPGVTKRCWVSFPGHRCQKMPVSGTRPGRNPVRVPRRNRGGAYLEHTDAVGGWGHTERLKPID